MEGNVEEREEKRKGEEEEKVKTCVYMDGRMNEWKVRKVRSYSLLFREACMAQLGGGVSL